MKVIFLFFAFKYTVCREKQKIMQIFKKKIRKSEGFTSTQNPPPLSKQNVGRYLKKKGRIGTTCISSMLFNAPTDYTNYSHNVSPTLNIQFISVFHFFLN